MTTLDISTPTDAIALFQASLDESFENFDFDEITIGEWANPQIHIPAGDSDVTAPFLEAFLATQHSIYVIVAEIKYGHPDVRKLTQEDLSQFQVRFRITGGSSNIIESVGETLKTIAKECVGKLSANQIVALISGGAILLSGTYGFSAYLEHRKEVRIAELKSEERKQELANSRYAQHDQVEATKFVAEKMAEQGGAIARIAEESTKTNAALLRAISQTSDTTVNGVRVTKVEAETLRQTKRRRSEETVIERLVKVVEINTTDRFRTTVELSGIGRDAVKVTFADRLIEDRDLAKLHRSLKERKSVRVKLEIRRVGDEIKSAEILRVTTPRN
jgi:hypothetical protein